MPLMVIPFPAIDPVAVSFGPFAVRWYALAYIAGLVVGWRYCLSLARRQPLLVNSRDVDYFLVWATLGVVLGGRIGYVLFYNFAYFAANPSEIVQLWNGGMSFHGGVIGCVVAMVLFALRRHLPVLSLADVTAAVAPIGLFLVRVANFINGELWGRPTDVPWAIVFPHGGPIPRHPSQLYEAALEGVFLFIVVALLVRFGALKRPGVITGVFALGYGATRITCEFFREPDAQLGFLWGGLTMGMLLCVPLIIGGIAVLIVAFQRMPKPKNGN